MVTFGNAFREEQVEADEHEQIKSRRDTGWFKKVSR